MICLDFLLTCLKTTTIKSRENMVYVVHWKTQFILAISLLGFIFFNSKDFATHTHDLEVYTEGLPFPQDLSIENPEGFY